MVNQNPVTSKGAPQMSPRGTERVRRRADQEAHAVQAVKEGAALTSPEGPAKQAQIKRNAEAQVARFGTTKQERTRTLQKQHAAQAETQLARLPTPPSGRPELPPAGQQVDLQTARRMAMAHDVEERDVTTEAAKAAGVAVREVLQGRAPKGPETRMRHVVEHNTRVERASAAAAAAVTAAK